MIGFLKEYLDLIKHFQKRRKYFIKLGFKSFKLLQIPMRRNLIEIAVTRFSQKPGCVKCSLPNPMTHVFNNVLVFILLL